MSNGDVNQIAAYLSDFNTKIVDLEEKHNILRDRVLMSDESFIKSLDSLKKEIRFLREDISEIKERTELLKDKIDQIITELENFARKEELHTVERYLRLWEPMEFVKTKEVRQIIKEELSNKRGKKKEE